MKNKQLLAVLAVIFIAGVFAIGTFLYFNFGKKQSIGEKYLTMLQTFGANEYDKAIELCHEIITLDSSHTKSYQKLVQSYFRAEKVGESIAFFDSLCAVQPENSNAYLGLGMSHKNAKNYELALQNYEKAIELDPNKDQAYALLVDGYKTLKMLDKGVIRLQELVEMYPDFAASHYGLGLAYYWTQTNWQKGIDEFEKAAELDSTLVDAYNKQGISYFILRNDFSSLKIFEKGLRIAKYQNDLESQSTFIGNIGIIYRRQENYDLALKNFEQALNLAKKIGYTFNVAAIYANVARINRDHLRNTDVAIKNYELAIEWYKKANHQIGVGRQLVNLAGIYDMEFNDLEKAEYYFKQAIAIYDSNAGALYDLSDALAGLSVIYQKKGKFQKAIEISDRSMEIAKQTDHLEVQAKVLANRSAIYEKLGDYEAAFASDEAALTLYHQLKDTANVLMVMFNQGVKNFHLENHTLAFQKAKEALELARQWGKDQSRLASLLRLLGAIYSGISEDERAFYYFREAQALAEEIGDTLLQANIFENIATMYSYAEEPDTALIYHRKALQLWGERLPKWLQSVIYTNMSGELIKLSQFASALDSAKLGLRIAEEINDLVYQGLAHYFIGDSYAKLGSYDDALQAYEKSAEISRKFGMAKYVWLAHYGIGEIFEVRENYAKAIDNYKVAINAIEGVRSQLSSEQQRTGYWQDKLKSYFSVVKLYSRLAKIENNPTHSTEAFHYAERAKARSQLDLISQNLASKQIKNIPDSTRRMHVSLGNQIQAKYAGITNKYSNEKPDKKRIRKLEEEIEILRARQDSVSLAMQKMNPHLSPRVLGLEEIQQKVLEPKQALVEYLIGSENAFVWVVTKDTCVFQSLGLGRKQIAGLLAKASPLFASGLDSSELHRSVISNHIEANFQFKALQALYDTLFAKPVLAHLPDDAELLIVPDDVLFYLPFELLVTGMQGDTPRYLIEQYPISYSASASLLSPELYQPSQASKTALALGDPQTEELPAENLVLFAEALPENNRTIHNNRFTPLPNAAREARNIGIILPDATAYYGKKASEALFKEQAGDYRILHLAVHGIANDREPMYSGVALAESDEPKEDGFVHAYEIFNMDLQAAMVVLSACESGTGKLLKGEGLLSLTRAFFAAGAHSVVASLWNANDASTAQLMSLFYQHLKAGKSRAQALQQAKIALIRSGGKNGNPFYWSPFVLVGQSGVINFSAPALTEKQ